MKDNLQDLKGRLEQLLACKNAAYSKLIIVQQNMAMGIISGNQLGLELKELHEQYEALRKDMLRSVPPESLVKKYPEGSLEELEDWLKAIEARERADFTKAKDVLGKVARLKHKDSKQNPLLQPCHEHAHEIGEQIEECRNEVVIQELASGYHPLARLLHLVVNHETLPDSEVETIEATITKSYGRSLALAAVMGRLCLGASPDETSSQSDDVVTSGLLDCSPVERLKAALPSSDVKVATADVVVVQQPDLDQALIDEQENVCGEVMEETTEDLQGEQLIIDESNQQTLETAGQPELESSVSTPEGVAALELAWQLLSRGDIAYAYYAAEEDKSVQELIQALLIGGHIRHGRGELASALTSIFYRVGDKKKPWEQCIIAAAAIKPALLAPETNARDILGALSLPGPLAHLQRACKTIAELGTSALGPAFFGKALDSAAWKKEAQSLKEEARHWQTAALQANFSFLPANRVWRYWVEPGGKLARLLDLVGEDTPWSEEMQDLVESFVNENRFRRLVYETDRKQLGRKVGEDILVRQMNQMMTRSRQAIQLLNRWFELMRIKPQLSAASNHSAANIVNTVLVAKRQDLLAEIAEARSSTADPYFRIALDVLSRSLDDACGVLLDPSSAGEEIELNVVMHKELLRVPAVALNEDWTIQVLPDDFIKQMVSVDSSKPWADVFEERCQKGDHIATKLILDLLSHIGGDHQVNAALIAKREKALRDAREALRNDTALTSKQVENALASGWLREGERALLSSRVAAIQATLEDALTFDEQHRILSEIRTCIKEKQDNQLEDVRRRLKQSPIDPESLDYSRIAEAIRGGNALTANEYIDLALRGEDLPDTSSPSRKFVDFIKKLPTISRYIHDRQTRTRIAEHLKKQKNFAGLDVSQVPGSRLKHAAAVWEQWNRTSSLKVATDLAVKTIFIGLGFEVKSVVRYQTNGHQWFDVQTEPLRNRNQCPIPWYGSVADGHYRVLCVYDIPPEEWMVNAVDDPHKTGATIVLHFGVFSEKKRRDLARLCRKRRKTVLVLDDIMLVYLCAERGERLPVFFECALPYTYCEPFTTTAGVIPPEMFYGRGRERRSIIDPMGSCFIFGGRQLGKTVLLREVVREFHQPADGKIGMWIDLKGEGVGLDRSADHVWKAIATEAKRNGILPSGYDTGSGCDCLADAFIAWLDQEPKRRILLLLDEADRFLEVESQGDGGYGEFSRVARLKALMDRTERRFKVVLAGLHNVQRTTRLSNHPLAHYGDPLCIGPLMDNGEWREAKALIERPMAALGYQFEEGKDLVTLILSQTNYYPSLIQLYCHHLLHHVTASIANSPEQPSGPPYTITERHVIEVYQNHELRRAIRERFLLTLGLDERFRVIAYIMAHYSRSDSTQRYINGFPVSWVRDKATTWWPKGFYNSSDEDSFRAMLDEMVGLGVLTIMSPGKYALRNPNIISLLGSDEEIIAELANIEREPPPEYAASNHRAPLRQGTQVIRNRRSPLTIQQESMVCGGVTGVTVLFGSSALGLDELPEFLLKSRDDLSVTIIDNVNNRTSAMSDVSNAHKTAITDKCLVLVTPNCNWTYRWVEEACKVVNNRGKTGVSLRVLFLADPKKTFQLSKENDSSLQSLGVDILTLKLWHDSELRRWLEDCDFGFVGSEMRAKLQVVTGCWPSLIREFWQLATARQKDKELALTDLAEKQATRDFALATIKSMGIDIGSPYSRLINLMNELGDEVSTQDISELLRNEGFSEESIKASITGAERLSLIRRGKESGGWQVEPVVASTLKVVSQHDI